MFKNGRRVFFCDALNFTKEHGLLQQSPHRKYEALRDVLATKYGINLKRKSGFVTRQYRKRTTDELNEEIAGLWDDIKKAEHAGFISFVPVSTE
jgi:hypothetical protein